MKLEGIHHITCITADAPGNVEFYAGTLGLRMVKKSVNQDDPTVYHLFYADEKGSPGSDITFFEYRGVPRGRAGAGMIHRIVWRVASEEALSFWAQRLGDQGVITHRDDGSLRFSDPEGLDLELRVAETTDEPPRAVHPEIPAEFALCGFDGARTYAADPAKSAGFLDEGMRFDRVTDTEWSVRGSERGSFYAYDEAPFQRGLSGAGTVHHIAFGSPMDKHATWREQIIAAGASPTPIIDRFWFKSIYFREPSGVLFEIATIGPGFDTDESLESLGQTLSLPPDYEHLRDELEKVLTPLPDPRAGAPAR